MIGGGGREEEGEQSMQLVEFCCTCVYLGWNSNLIFVFKHCKS